jgi:asparagine synthase (glutamine-hydrolysing)
VLHLLLETKLRGSLREWADDLLNEQRLEREGYLHPEPVQKMWQAHLAGKRGLEHQLWNVLMFQAWLETER